MRLVSQLLHVLCFPRTQLVSSSYGQVVFDRDVLDTDELFLAKSRTHWLVKLYCCKNLSHFNVILCSINDLTTEVENHFLF